MRIKLPKLLVKIMRKRKEKKCSHDNGNGNIDNGTKKKSSIFFKGRSRNRDGSSNDHDAINGSSMVEAITVIESLLGTDDCHTGDNEFVCIDDQSGVQKVVPGIGKPTLSISRSFREMLPGIGKPTLSISRSFREMLHNVGNFSGRKDSYGKQVSNKDRRSFILNKMNVSKISNCNALIPSAILRDTNGSRNHKCSKVTPCAPNGKPRGRKIGGVKEEANTMELCKRRILMGKRCRSLNMSGSLQYDEKGIMLPEEIIPAQDI